LRLSDRIRGWFGFAPNISTTTSPLERGSVDHFLIVDGTMSSLQEGLESNAGLTYKLLREMAPRGRMSIRYEAGVQWRRWRDILDVIEGRGINRQIRRAYGFIASRYRPGDRIFLIGYSRGAYAVRSLAGIIDRVGLLKAEHANVRNIRQIYRHYQLAPDTPSAKAFAQTYCHGEAPIEMVGVWDTVKSLGINVPLLWRLSKIDHEFHSHALGPSIQHGFHALAMDETRLSYAPVLWKCPDNYQGHVVQMWFRGSHGDIGGQLGGDNGPRPLSNIPLVWMLENISACGVALPDEWQNRFPQDVTAPSLGTLKGWGKLLISRRKRTIGRDKSEQVHESVRVVTGSS
jgi:uncharacterized protein (DUF2235 family)